MQQDIDLDIASKVKQLLGIENECSLPEMCILLREHRNSVHPDKFSDENAKREAEEKFKETQKLLEDLDRLIQQQQIAKRPSDIALYKP
jgi:hypothetical protein